MENLKLELSKFGDLQVCKEGVVLTVLITGTKLSNWETAMKIQKSVVEYAGDKFPNIECMRNDETFFLIVLKPKS